VVASPREASAIRAACGEDFVLVTPGIRPAGSDPGDQHRTTTPAEAVRAGSHILVVGRPITAAAAPAEEAQKILDEIEHARSGH
jgi:orotidine-5'-phosphate decarboxylase